MIATRALPRCADHQAEPAGMTRRHDATTPLPISWFRPAPRLWTPPLRALVSTEEFRVVSQEVTQPLPRVS